MTRAAIGLGSSLGDRLGTIRLAVAAIGALPGTHLLRASRVVVSPPAGGTASAPFLNAVILLETALEADVLLRACRRIERRLGRHPARRWADRRIDIDLLVYGALEVTGPEMTVPHPRIGERPFVLEPLAEVWPDAPWQRGGQPPVHPRRPLPIAATLPRRGGR